MGGGDIALSRNAGGQGQAGLSKEEVWDGESRPQHQGLQHHTEERGATALDL